MPVSVFHQTCDYDSIVAPNVSTQLHYTCSPPLPSSVVLLSTGRLFVNNSIQENDEGNYTCTSGARIFILNIEIYGEYLFTCMHDYSIM